MRETRGRVWIAQWAAATTAAALLVSAPAAAAGEFYYYVDGDEVVITNTPSRADVRVLPGFAERVRSLEGRMPPSRFDPLIRLAAAETGVDPELIKAVAMVESAMNPRAVSPKGAMGLMQLMPATAEAYGVVNPFDPRENLRAGARHLRDLLDEFGGDRTLALAAYNAGSGAVRRHGGVPGYPETRQYVRKVHHRLEGRPRPLRTPARREPSSLQIRLADDGSLMVSN